MREINEHKSSKTVFDGTLTKIIWPLHHLEFLLDIFLVEKEFEVMYWRCSCDCRFLCDAVATFEFLLDIVPFSNTDVFIWYPYVVRRAETVQRASSVKACMG